MKAALALCLLLPLLPACSKSGGGPAAGISGAAARIEAESRPDGAPTAKAGVPGEAAQKEFLEAFEAAFRANDASAAKRLYCLDGVEDGATQAKDGQLEHFFAAGQGGEYRAYIQPSDRYARMNYSAPVFGVLQAQSTKGDLQPNFSALVGGLDGRVVISFLKAGPPPGPGAYPD